MFAGNLGISLPADAVVAEKAVDFGVVDGLSAHHVNGRFADDLDIKRGIGHVGPSCRGRHVRARRRRGGISVRGILWDDAGKYSKNFARTGRKSVHRSAEASATPRMPAWRRRPRAIFHGIPVALPTGAEK